MRGGWGEAVRVPPSFAAHPKRPHHRHPKTGRTESPTGVRSQKSLDPIAVLGHHSVGALNPVIRATPRRRLVMPCHPPGATLRQHPGAGAGRTSRPVTDHMLAHEANAQRRAAEIAPAAPVVVE